MDKINTEAYLRKLKTLGENNLGENNLVKIFDSQGRPHVFLVINDVNGIHPIDVDANTYKQI